MRSSGWKMFLKLPDGVHLSEKPSCESRVLFTALQCGGWARFRFCSRGIGTGKKNSWKWWILYILGKIFLEANESSIILEFLTSDVTHRCPHRVFLQKRDHYAILVAQNSGRIALLNPFNLWDHLQGSNKRRVVKVVNDVCSSPPSGTDKKMWNLPSGGNSDMNNELFSIFESITHAVIANWSPPFAKCLLFRRDLFPFQSSGKWKHFEKLIFFLHHC